MYYPNDERYFSPHPGPHPHPGPYPHPGPHHNPVIINQHSGLPFVAGMATGALLTPSMNPVPYQPYPPMMYPPYSPYPPTTYPQNPYPQSYPNYLYQGPY